MPELLPLDPTALCRRCDPEVFGAATTEGLPEPDESFGQARAVEALRLALEVDAPGYNVFVLGEPGSNRHATVRRLLDAHATRRAPPGDWCYINNFAEPARPRALQLPAGRGAGLRADMQRFVSELGQAIGAGFDGDEYRASVEAIQEEFKKREEHALGELGDAAVAESVAFVRTPQGFAFVPMKNSETLDAEAFANLPEAERERFAHSIEQLRERLHKLMQQFPRSRREMQARIRAVSRDTMTLAVGHLIEEIKEHFGDLPVVLSFLDDVLRDVVELGQELREQASRGGDTTQTPEGGISAQRYQVNLLVDQDARPSAPCISEAHPTYPNLVGRVDQFAHMGTVVTNFTLIKPGALHRANGGYLMLDADKVLAQPYAWEGLKRALKAGEIRIESLAQVVGWAGALPLDPDPIPLSIKLVLFGERRHYYLLKALDPEFDELFKVAADFDDVIERTDENVRGYARMLGSLARGRGLRSLDGGALARLVEHGARIAGDAGRLTARVRELEDLLQEADHHARRAERPLLTRADVEAALAGRIRRADRLRERAHEAVLDETVMIATSGAHVGQINGLAVIDPGDFRFGRPLRITATARPGESGVVDIERKAELGGALHTKGVMILSSFLAARYAGEQPLSLSASLVFEQSYGPVEGDSASLAELCALLSALSGVPIRQAFAVTGSVNQHGAVQAIGGVNEKIEGFFDLCRARGLAGDQGVVIPHANVRHLMLRDDVVAAAADSRFHIYAVSTVDEAIGVLTGVAAGRPDAAGGWPTASVNRRVADRLAKFVHARDAHRNGDRRGRNGDADAKKTGGRRGEGGLK